MPETPKEMSLRSMEMRAAGQHAEADDLLEQAIEKRIAERPAGYESWTPQQVADFFGPIVFTGGPPHKFEAVGRASFIAMLEHGLLPTHTVLDVGCGALRIGYWLINFLQPGRYCGLEPAAGMPKWGIAHLVGPDVAQAKRPRFESNLEFDFTGFGEKFDFYVARSIWSHTTRAQIEICLDQFAATANPEAIFLVSYVPAREGPGYLGDQWVAMPLVEHSFEWIASEAKRRGLSAREAGEMGGQTWIRIEHEAAAARPLPASAQGAAPAPAHVPPPAPAGLVGRLKGALKS